MKLIELTIEDNGKTFKVNPGQMAILRLKENPTTGYLWKVLDKHGLELESKFNPSPDAMIGGGGTREFKIRFMDEGEYVMKLKHWCSWEKEKSNIELFSVNFRVTTA